MYFTQEDFRKIERWLQQRAVKDTQLPLANPLTGAEQLALVQNGENKLVPLHLFVEKLNDMDIPDFYNVTDRKNKAGITLWEAIHLVPVEQRRVGLVITFLDRHNNWNVVQFKGMSVHQWDELNLWRGLFEGFLDVHIYHPDDEDIVGVQDGNRKFLKIKDRAYDVANFSGKGRKILRKNLVGSQACSIDDEDHYENVLYQEDFLDDNTVYIVRYDFLIKEHIRIPAGCELLFEGGTLNGGSIDLNGCKLNGIVGPESDYLVDTVVTNWAKGQIEYRDNEIQYWNEEEWVTAGEIPINQFYTKADITKILEDYALKANYYTKVETDNIVSKFVVETVFNDAIDSVKKEIADAIARRLTLDQVQQAINAGCDVDLALPSANDGKVSLPIWTGTAEEYEAISPKVSGMTYNIIDTEEEIPQ